MPCVAILHVFSILSIFSILFCESRGHDSCERESFLIYRKVFQNFSGQPAHIDINPRHSSAVLSYMNHCLIRCVVFKPDPVTFLHVAENTAVWTGHHFKTDDGLIFVGACGIAVRSIAPYVASKKSDPAVLVVDECGKFVISLLSGHLGGANALALKTAEILGAEPVVTTATDLHDRFAVDVFAKNNHCAIFNMKAAKEVSAAILAGESVGFYSEFPWAGSLPRGLKVCTPEDSGKPEAGIAVTVHRACLPFTSTVQIVPKAVVLGLGCKKDKEAEIIRQEAEACLESESIYQEAVSQIAITSLPPRRSTSSYNANSFIMPFSCARSLANLLRITSRGSESV